MQYYGGIVNRSFQVFITERHLSAAPRPWPDRGADRAQVRLAAGVIDRNARRRRATWKASACIAKDDPLAQLPDSSARSISVVLDRLELVASNQTAAVDLMRAVLCPLGYSEWEEPSPERGNDVLFGSDARAPVYRLFQARPAEDGLDGPRLWFHVTDQAVFDEIVHRVETVMAAVQSETDSGADGSRSFSALLPGFASIVVSDA